MDKDALPKKSERVIARLTPAEKQVIAAHAKAHKLSLSDYLRHCLLDPEAQRPVPAPPADDAAKALRRRELAAWNRIGNNLNQLARHANALRGATHTPALIAQLDAIRRGIDQHFNRSSGRTPDARQVQRPDGGQQQRP